MKVGQDSISIHKYFIEFKISHTHTILIIYNSTSEILSKHLDQIGKEYSSLIDNDTLVVCKESNVERREFVTVYTESMRSPSSSSTTSSSSATLAASSSQDSQLPIIYFVTPTYPR